MKRNFSFIALLLFQLWSMNSYGQDTSLAIEVEKRFANISEDISRSFNVAPPWTGDKKFITCLHFIKSKQWDKCLTSLNKISTTFTSHNNDFINYLYGVSYQNSGKAQLALNKYSRVNKSSRYYVHSQLNIALLQAKHGRPTEAIKIVDALIKLAPTKISREMLNKLYISQAHIYFINKNFSASRLVLKKVSIDSQYINYATVALALSHIYVGEFTSARSFLSYLTIKSMKDHPADAAYILLAFAHSQAKHFSKSTVNSYKNAIIYYKKRIAEIHLVLKKKSGLPIINSQASDHIYLIENNILDLAQDLPDNFLANYTSLASLAPHISSTTKRDNIHRATARLHKFYEQTVHAEAKKQLLKRKELLTGYLDQCMYAHARLLYQNKL